jgi:hypothetical protein
LDLCSVDEKDVGLTRLGDGFRYRVVGVLEGAVLDAGIRFEDEMFAREYQYLSGRTVAVEADRVQIAFE